MAFGGLLQALISQAAQIIVKLDLAIHPLMLSDYYYYDWCVPG